jgi:hypothetical protein
MRRRAAILAVATVAALAGTALGPAGAALPSPGGVLVDQAEAGGRSVTQIGPNTADTLRSVLGPLVIVLVGAGGVVAFFRRDIGIAVTLAVIALFLGLFIFAPTEAKHLIESFWKKITG